MAIALVTGCHDIDRAPGSSNDAVTGGAGFDSTGANLLVVGIARYNSGGATTLTDSKGNNGNYVALTEYGKNNRALSRLYYCTNSPTVGTNHTFTAAGEYNKSIGAMAFSGAHATSPLDTATGNSDIAVGGLSLQPGSVTPSEDNCLVVTHIHNFTVTTNTSISGYTKNSHVAPYSAGIAYNVQTSAAATNPTWTWTSDYAFCAASIAVFKPAAGGIIVNLNFIPAFLRARARRRSLYRR